MVFDGEIREGLIMTGDRAKIGDILIEEGVITEEEFKKVISENAQEHSTLAVLLNRLRSPSRADLAELLGSQYEIPVIQNLSQLEFSRECLSLVPEDMARKHALVPIRRLGHILFVATDNFLNKAGLMEVRRHTGLKVKLFRSEPVQVLKAIDKLYHGVNAPSDPSAKPVRAIRLGAERGERDHSAEEIVKEWHVRYGGTGPVKAIKLGPSD